VNIRLLRFVKEPWLVVVVVIVIIVIHNLKNNYTGKLLHLCLGSPSDLFLLVFSDYTMHVPFTYGIICYNVWDGEKSVQTWKVAGKT
jgi:hypothetical protein